MNADNPSGTTWPVLWRGVRKGMGTFWLLMRVMIPVYVIVTLLGHTPVLPALARFFQPAMSIWHLPGDAALAMVLGHFVNLYSALAVIAAGKWDATAVTVAAIILGVSHNHILESAILKQMRAPTVLLVALRLVVGWSLGWVVAVLIA
jgi:hypothetical protein